MRGFDVSAIGLTALCGAHCLAVPAAATVLPAAGFISDHGPEAHLVMFAAAFALAVAAWFVGRTPNLGVVLIGLAGLTAMLIGAIEPIAHQSLGVALTLGGATVLAAAHVLNIARPAACRV